MVWRSEIEFGHPLSPWIRWWIVVIVTEIHLDPNLKQFGVENLCGCGAVHTVTGRDRLA